MQGEVVEVSGFYVNGELNGKPDGSGKSMTLKQDFATLSFTESNHYILLVGIELKKPWTTNQAYSTLGNNILGEENSNLVGQVLEINEETGIDEIIADKKNPEPDGTELTGVTWEREKPSEKGLYISNGKKVEIQ